MSTTQSDVAAATNGTTATGNGTTHQAISVPKVPSTGPVSQPVAAQPSALGHVASTATPAEAKTGVPIASPTVAPAPPEVHQPPNPIDEDPSAMWYVRPPSGGEYGPASGEIMKKWIDEGRVSSDSLVWREGWGDWQTAGPLFPQLGGAAPSAASGTPAAPAPPEMLGTPSFSGPGPDDSPRPYTRRRGNNSLAVVMVVLLTLASLGLFGVLIAVIRFMQ